MAFSLHAFRIFGTLNFFVVKLLTSPRHPIDLTVGKTTGTGGLTVSDKLHVLKGDGKRDVDICEELSDRIKGMIYEYEGRIALSTAVGILHVTAFEIMTEHSD